MALKRHLLRDQIREALLHRIGSGELEPGHRIVEARICEEMGVSAIPVREAIRELVAMGLLEFANHKGAWVREVSITETIDALQVRAALESLAAVLAAAALRGHCEELLRCYEGILQAARRRDFIAFQDHNQHFHRAIMEASGNGVLLRVWNSLGFEVRTRPIMEFLARRDTLAIAREHEAILVALKAGRGKKAAALLASHSNHLVEYLRQQLKSNPQP